VESPDFLQHGLLILHGLSILAQQPFFLQHAQSHSAPFLQHGESCFLQQQSSEHLDVQDVIFLQQSFFAQQAHLQSAGFLQQSMPLFLQQQSSEHLDVQEDFCMDEQLCMVLQPGPAKTWLALKPATVMKDSAASSGSSVRSLFIMASLSEIYYKVACPRLPVIGSNTCGG